MYSFMRVIRQKAVIILSAVILSFGYIAGASALEITGAYDANASKVIILIDDNEVINDHVSQWDGSGELYGEYMGLEVLAECDFVAIRNAEFEECAVFVDDDFEALLLLE